LDALSLPIAFRNPYISTELHWKQYDFPHTQGMGGEGGEKEDLLKEEDLPP
jgi:hypothetical protein